VLRASLDLLFACSRLQLMQMCLSARWHYVIFQYYTDCVWSFKSVRLRLLHVQRSGFGQMQVLLACWLVGCFRLYYVPCQKHIHVTLNTYYQIVQNVHDSGCMHSCCVRCTSGVLPYIRQQPVLGTQPCNRACMALWWSRTHMLTMMLH